MDRWIGSEVDEGERGKIARWMTLDKETDG